MDHKPEAAIQALNDSRTTVLPKDLQDQRKMIEAKAWLDLNQNDHALELVAKDTSADADGVRAEVAWRMRNWNQVGALLEKVLGDRWKETGAPGARSGSHAAAGRHRLQHGRRRRGPGPAAQPLRRFRRAGQVRGRPARGPGRRRGHAQPDPRLRQGRRRHRHLRRLGRSHEAQVQGRPVGVQQQARRHWRRSRLGP
ncbi:MAG: hypothetical protein WDN45_04925 [Caulobacteraceae bacterium]